MPSIYCDCIEDILWDKVYADAFSFNACVDAWRIQISSNLQLIDCFDHILSQDEQARASRYHQEKDRQRFMLSRIALRFLLAKYTNSEPEKIKSGIGLNKKPFIQNNSTPDLHYNLSHAGDWILIAISNSDVGIDIEKMDEKFSYSEILRHNFSHAEIDFITDGKKPVESFYLLWTRKEALLKATSKGIDNDLPFVPCLDGEHIVDQKIIGSDENFCVSSFKIGDVYVGSIASPKKCQLLRFRDINEFSFPKQASF